MFEFARVITENTLYLEAKIYGYQLQTCQISEKVSFRSFLYRFWVCLARRFCLSEVSLSCSYVACRIVMFSFITMFDCSLRCTSFEEHNGVDVINIFYFLLYRCTNFLSCLRICQSLSPNRSLRKRLVIHVCFQH